MIESPTHLRRRATRLTCFCAKHFALYTLHFALIFALSFCAGGTGTLNFALAQPDDSWVPTISVPSDVSSNMPQPGVAMGDAIQSSDELGGKPGDMSLPLPDYLRGGPDFWTSPEGMVPTLQIMLLLTVLTLAPAIVIMTTSFVRIVVVLSILRQAVGTNQLPPSQVITSLALFLTFLIMAPVWQEVYREAVVPYTERRIPLAEATARAEKPIRTFMVNQIEATGNVDDIWLFMQYIPDAPEELTETNVPWRALLPAYMISELKTAFLIGFQIYLPFLILDMVIASVMVSMGMMMLPPAIISLPFKLMLFVLVGGWNLVVVMLLQSFEWYG